MRARGVVGEEMRKSRGRYEKKMMRRCVGDEENTRRK